jgi:hypothetical protein
MTKDTETERGKDSIISPPPKKSFLDRASNRLSRTIAQIRTSHCLCTPYLKRIRKARGEPGKSKWEKPLADSIMATGVGLLSRELHDPEA